MTGIRPIYDAWLLEYTGATDGVETMFSIDKERPELPNLGSRDVLDYAYVMSQYVTAYVEQAINAILVSEEIKDEYIDIGFEHLEAALGAFYMGQYYYDEMQDAIGELRDRDFMMTGDTARYFMWVIQIWDYVHHPNNGPIAAYEEEDEDDC